MSYCSIVLIPKMNQGIESIASRIGLAVSLQFSKIFNINSFKRLTMGIILILALVVAALIFYQKKTLTTWRKNVVNLQDEISEDNFLQLSENARRFAIELAWKPYETFAQAIPAGTVAIKILALFFGIIGWIFICFAGLLVVIYLSESPNPMGFVFAIAIGALGFYFLKLRKENKLLLASTMAEDEERKTAAIKLRELAAQYINSRIPAWLEEAKRTNLPLAKGKFNINCSHSFCVFSKAASDLQDYLQKPKVEISFFFSNGLLSVVSGVVLDIRNTSYSLVSNPDGVISVTPSSEWAYEEFHYSDVVQVSFTPNREENTDILSDGSIRIVLSSGTEKQFPSSKDGISDFQEVVRERVRSIKEKTYHSESITSSSQSQDESSPFKSYCTKCGNKIGATDRFCGGCGSPI